MHRGGGVRHAQGSFSILSDPENRARRPALGLEASSYIII